MAQKIQHRAAGAFENNAEITIEDEYYVRDKTAALRGFDEKHGYPGLKVLVSLLKVERIFQNV